MKLLLRFFKWLKYEEVVKYAQSSESMAYGDREVIRVEPEELYIVAEGEILTMTSPVPQDPTALPLPHPHHQQSTLMFTP